MFWFLYFVIGLVYLFLPYTQNQIKTSLLENNDFNSFPKRVQDLMYQSTCLIVFLFYPFFIITSAFFGAISFLLKLNG